MFYIKHFSCPCIIQLAIFILEIKKYLKEYILNKMYQPLFHPPSILLTAFGLKVIELHRIKKD